MNAKTPARGEPRREPPGRPPEAEEPAETDAEADRAGKPDIVDQAGKDSFPASDPPPWTP